MWLGRDNTILQYPQHAAESEADFHPILIWENLNQTLISNKGNVESTKANKKLPT